MSRLSANALVPLAAYAACRSRLQAVSVTGFWIAVFVMWVWGRWVIGFLAPSAEGDAQDSRLGFFTTVFLGQFTLLLLAGALLPLNALFARLTSVEFTLHGILLATTIAVLIALGRRAHHAGLRSHQDATLGASFVLTVLGAAPASAVVALYSGHLSALGLDVHQHMYWALRIVDAGYVPLAERHTDVISDYPKTFHLLCALWNASGVVWRMGPTVKAMPFLQSWLSAMVVNEIVLHGYCSATRGREGGASIVACVLGVGLTIYAYLLVPMVYPIWDLIGTARFSANALLFLPLALVLLGTTHRWPRAITASLLAVPLVLVWSLTFNVAVFAGALSFVLPYHGTVVYLSGAWHSLPDRSRLVSGCAISVLMGIGIALQDPSVLAQLARQSDTVAAVEAGMLSVRTLEEAARTGDVPPPSKYVGSGSSPVRMNAIGYIGMGVAAVGATAWQVVRYPVQVGQELGRLVIGNGPSDRAGSFRNVLGFPLANTKPYGAAVLFLTPVMLLGATGTTALARHRFPGRKDGVTAAKWRFMLAIVTGTAVGNIGYAFTADVMGRLREGSGPIMQLVGGYVQMAGLHMGPFFYWIIPAFAFGVLASETSFIRAAGRASRLMLPRIRVEAGPLGVAILVIWIGLVAQVQRVEIDAASHRGWEDGVSSRDLRALRRIEQMIPEGDAVLVPAEHREIGSKDYAENWVIPVGATTALLPYVRGKFVFNVNLGYSRLFGWQQLRDDLCSPDGDRRRRFIRAARVRWFFVRAPQLDRREVFDAVRVCGRTLAELGVVFPPVVVKRQQTLFAVE